MTTWGNITFFRGYNLPDKKINYKYITYACCKNKNLCEFIKKHGANCDKFTNRQSYQE